MLTPTGHCHGVHAGTLDIYPKCLAPLRTERHHGSQGLFTSDRVLTIPVFFMQAGWVEPRPCNFRLW